LQVLRPVVAVVADPANIEVADRPKLPGGIRDAGALSQGVIEHAFALVTPDARLYDNETYDCDSWESEVLKILDEYAGCSAVAVD
jgi:hypothetical protein